MMDYFEVGQIGRESVKSVNASILASLIRQLVNKYEQANKGKTQNYRYYIRCKEKFEIVQRRTGDDEGFESDANDDDVISGDGSSSGGSSSNNDDARSTASSCFLVDDHVFRIGKLDRDLSSSPFPFTKESDSPNSSVGSSDSANSSGSSDTDELDVHSPAPSPTDKYRMTAGKKRRDRGTIVKREEHAIGDVIFCHTDPKYPTIIAWVIKKAAPTAAIDSDPSSSPVSTSRLGKTGVETIPKNENCLEVVITKCKTVDGLRDLCSSYQEFSKRIKLDQYQSMNRKRDGEKKTASVSLASLLDASSKDAKVSLSDMKVTTSGLIKASELSILNPKIIANFQQPEMKTSVSLNSLIKSDKVKVSGGIESKVPETESEDPLRRAHSLLNLSKPKTVLKDISSGLNDHFNLLQRTDPNGMTHLEVSKGGEGKDRFVSKSKIRKEIEGVILTDADSYATKKEHVRQRQSPGLVENIPSWQENADAPPPIRPERRKYVKKKGLAPSPPVGRYESPPAPAPSTFYISHRQDKIVKGPYIRVQSWGNQNVLESETLGSWKPERLSRMATPGAVGVGERRRSKSATRTAKRTPMAYRYIDITDDAGYYRGGPAVGCPGAAGNTSRLYGLSQKIREIGGSVVGGAGTARRRRNSFDDIIHLDNRVKGNLKSVIKKNKKVTGEKCCEPKKVTFSAFATVQVVD